MTTRKARILYVEDEVIVAKRVCNMLESHGYEVQMAFSGMFALAKLYRGDFDLVITDIRMPEMDGIELIRQIRKFKPDQRVIVATAYPSQYTAREAFKLGSINYIAKPFSDDRLLQVVDHAVREQQKGLVGSVQLTCEELIQLYAMGQRTIILEVHRDDSVGHIYFKEGRIIHAKTENHQGEDAFYEIQSWGSGTFTTRPCNEKVACSIERSVEGLLLEGAKRQDERTRKEKKL